MKNIYFILAIIATVAAVPALYAGALLMAHFETFYLFPVPALLCIALAGVTLTKYERIA